VPQPSKTLNDNSQTAKYKLNNTAPLRALDARAVQFIDLNQDGHLDLLVGSNKDISGLLIEWGDGLGGWKKEAGPSTSVQPLSFAASDYNHNQNIDILIGGDGAEKGLQIWEFDSSSKQWMLVSTPATEGSFSSVKFADINQDGWDDIIATQFDKNNSGGVLVLLNNAKGGWTSNTGPAIQGIFTDLAVEDINNDGYLDIIASQRGGLGSEEYDDEVWSQVGGAHIWYGDGNAHWKAQELAANSDAESLSVADIDGDGDLDIILGLYLKGITYWLNNNSEWEKETLIEDGTWSALRVGDLDADGSRELIAASSVGQGIRVWHIHGSSFAEDTSLTPQFGSYFDIDLGDIYGDGTLAIAASNADAGVEVWTSKKTAALPLQEFMGDPVGSELTLPFPANEASLTSDASIMIEQWLNTLPSKAKDLWVKLKAISYEHIHTDLYPSPSDLSLARAEKIKQVLVLLGVDAKHIHTEVVHPSASELMSHAHDAGVVKLQAFQINTARLPTSIQGRKNFGLYDVQENKVFKTIHGLPEYKVDAGDELSITFWRGAKPDKQKVTVQVDGTVSLPYQAALNVGGKTSSEIDNLITSILKKYERNPRVDVAVLKPRSKHVSIFGEINSLSRQPTGPGTYILSGKETVVEAISRAGGPSKDADLNHVQVIRNSKTITLNLKRAIQQGDTTEDLVIDDKDTIFIPSLAQSKRQVYVLGEVNKVGIVKFTDDINFLDAISQSGGLTPDAYLPDIRVLRTNRDKPEILAVDFERFMEQGDLTQNLALMDKDIIIIPSRPIANWNKYIKDITPTITLLLQPVSVAQQILTLRVLSGQIK
jgi:polysaccharide export outer membrane protein